VRAELDEKGMLVVKPETPVEAYALRKWTLDNFRVVDPLEPGENHFLARNLIFHTSL